MPYGRTAIHIPARTASHLMQLRLVKLYIRKLIQVCLGLFLGNVVPFGFCIRPQFIGSIAWLYKSVLL